MISEAFERANRLWFHEGRTAAALAAYKEALRETPDDPVLAFQLARVLWSMDRFDEARSLLEQSANNREKLSEGGQSVLDMWIAKLEHLPERLFPQWTPAMLDRDELEKDASADRDWLTIADAASVRKMFGLASYAIEQWEGVPIDAEDAKDIDNIETDRAMEENMLVQMYAEFRQATPAAVAPSEPDIDFAKSDWIFESSAVITPVETVRPPVSTQPPLETSHQDLPTIPLSLSVKITPIEGPVGVNTTVEASLSNPTDKPQVVNRRMLINHVNAPGEIWLDVDGPEGYRNMRGFRVRVGEASDEFFTTLAPGESVEQSWDLDDYHSLHVPGDYEVTLTYHNEDNKAPDGRPMAIGKVTGSTRIRRY